MRLAYGEGMNDAAPRMFVWDIPGGACGATHSREQALVVVGGELATNDIGTTAQVMDVRVSQIGVGYVPVAVVGRAERTERGVVWHETAVADAP